MSTVKTSVPLCSLQGLRKTIQYDYYTYRWFLFLISQSTFQREARRDPEFDAGFRTIQAFRLVQGGLGLILFFAVGIFLASAAWPYAVLAVMMVLGEWNVMSRKKRCVADIACTFVARDVPPEILARSTLYQVSERYSERYHILSLVDAISQLDRIFRFSLIFIFFFVAYITHIPQWRIQQCLFVILFFAVVFLANMDFFYHRYK